jgi:hypothetical protein
MTPTLQQWLLGIWLYEAETIENFSSNNRSKKKVTFDVSIEPVMLIKFAPASVARAFAKRVFPVPGGPKSKTPLQGWKGQQNKSC